MGKRFYTPYHYITLNFKRQLRGSFQVLLYEREAVTTYDKGLLVHTWEPVHAALDCGTKLRWIPETQPY